MRIEIFRRLTLFGVRWFFRIIAANGESVAQSEGYSRKIDCRGTANLLKNGLGRAEIVDA